MSGKWRNLSLHIALDLSFLRTACLVCVFGLPCEWVKSCCILQLAHITTYFISQDCNNPSFLGFLVKNKTKIKKKKKAAVLFQSNQTKEIIRIYLWALTAHPDKANSVGMWSQCQADLWKVLSTPVCWQDRVSTCVCVRAEMMEKVQRCPDNLFCILKFSSNGL